MKTLKNWKTFNEMNDMVYKRAAKQFRELGFENKAKRLEEHPEFLRDIENQERYIKLLKTYKDIESFTFNTKSKGIKIVGNFIGLDPFAIYDMWFDNNQSCMAIVICFLISIDDSDKKYLICPFWIYYEDGKVGIDGPFSFDETPLRDIYNESEEPILFDNRKDANRFIHELKTNPIIEDDIHKVKYSNPKEKKEFIKMYKETIGKLNAKMLYKD